MDYIRLKLLWNSSSSTSETYQDLPYPKKFEMHKVPNIVNELHTMSGNTLYDVNGWKWADTTIEWGTLYPEALHKLLHVIDDINPTRNDLYIRFVDPEGQTQEIKAVLKSFKKAKTLVRYGSDYVWEGVSIDLSFPDCYPYTS